MSSKEKKFNEAEIIIGGLATLGVDAVAFLLDLTAIGYIIATPLQAFTSFMTSLWASSKGDLEAFKAKRQVIKQASNFLPWVPTCFVFFVWEVVKLNNPEIAGKIDLTKGKKL
ncbi:MAG: hypothetical protein WDZ80_04930 [Candidatus Paceibacterota bacterium]